MKQYNFLQDEWNGSPKTVWSRKKQNKLFFPIVVMPQRIIVSYFASRSDDKIIVTDDEIKIL